MSVARSSLHTVSNESCIESWNIKCMHNYKFRVSFFKQKLGKLSFIYLTCCKINTYHTYGRAGRSNVFSLWRYTKVIYKFFNSTSYILVKITFCLYVVSNDSAQYFLLLEQACSQWQSHKILLLLYSYENQITDTNLRIHTLSRFAAKICMNCLTCTKLRLSVAASVTNKNYVKFQYLFQG